MAGRLAVVSVVVLLAGVLVACDDRGPDRVHTYRIATRGPVTADVGEFGRHVAATLSDPRGWSLGGAISFRQVNGAADFTVWLATAASLPSFGPPCHPDWSCRSGPNVIINENRWLNATPTWPYGLGDYRHYVVNHEVGHWLGYGHLSCDGGFLTRAPVMAQQSKGGAAKGACRFNVWPTPRELSGVAAARGISVRPTGLPTPDDPFGHLDRVEVARDADGRPVRVRVVGWALDGDTADPLGVVVLVDGVPVDIVAADRPRPDVAARFPRYGDRRGFDATVEVRPDAGVVCVAAGGVAAGLAFVQLGCDVVK